MKTEKRNVKKVVLAIILIIILSVGVYTGIYFIQTVSSGSLLENMVEDSKTKSTEFEGGVSVNDGGKTIGITFVADNDSKISEMYLAEKTSWFGTDMFDRFELTGHYYTVDPLGVAYETLETRSGNTKYAFLYTNNVNEISKVYVQMISKENGSVYWEKAHFPAMKPFVQVIELKNEKTEVQYFVCYDIDGNVVYERGIKADF